MGMLIPDDFDLRDLKNDEERAVVQAMVDDLTDGWLIIPSLTIRTHRDHELDVVLVHPDYGVFDIEVKGHRVWLEGGVWRDARGRLEMQPTEQAKKNSYELRSFLRNMFPADLAHLDVYYGVVFPNTTEIRGHLPPGIRRSQVMVAADLEDISSALQTLRAEASIGMRLTDDHVRAIISRLAPDADFVWDIGERTRRASRRLESLCAAQVRSLERLDVNRKVVVTGGAGTGKTRLALGWARRALVRGERTLVTCFNVPLAEMMRTYMFDDDNLVIGPFIEVVKTFDGMPAFSEPVGLSAAERKEFYDVTVVGHLHRHWPDITERFDTIIIDEAQDFSPAWIAQLESLLDPDGPRRIMMVADAGQDIFDRGFQLPTIGDGWTMCELVNNCRNTHQIAKLLRGLLGGAPAPVVGPESIGIEFDLAGSDYVESVGAILSRLRSEGAEKTAAVITMTVQVRDALRAAHDLGPWETRHERIICESVRRLKGTEFDTVIVVDPFGEMDRQEMYIAVSRAVNRLFVVGSAEVGQRLRLRS